MYVAVSNVTSSILMGKTFEYDDEEFLRFADLVQEVSEYWAAGTLNYHVSFLAHLPLKTNRRANDAIKRMFDFIVEVVDHERRSFNPSDKPRNLIQYILRERKECMSKVRYQTQSWWLLISVKVYQEYFNWNMYKVAIQYSGLDKIQWCFLFFVLHTTGIAYEY